jgi:hypothetical protein
LGASSQTRHSTVRERLPSMGAVTSSAAAASSEPPLAAIPKCAAPERRGDDAAGQGEGHGQRHRGGVGQQRVEHAPEACAVRWNTPRSKASRAMTKRHPHSPAHSAGSAPVTANGEKGVAWMRRYPLPGLRPIEAPGLQLAETVILRGFARSDFGISSSSTPLLTRALMRSASTSLEMAKRRM